MKLLIVEDEPRIGHYLRQGLSEAGFAVDWVSDGLEGEQLALSGDYDLLLLDVLLPGRDGWQLLHAVRATGLGVPVLILFDSDTNVIEVAIRHLRAKVDDPFPHKLIHTVRGMGYVLEEQQA
ncbi:MAG: response regulator [Pseudomonas sp.]